MEKQASEGQIQNEKKEPEESILDHFLKQKERGESKLEFLIKQGKQGMEVFYKKNIKFLKALRSRAGEEQKKIGEKLDAVFKELYKNSKDFRNAINGLPPQIHRLDELLVDWERQKVFNKNTPPDVLKQFDLLVNLHKKLKLEFEHEIWIEKSKSKRWRKIDCYGRLPILSLYKVRGENIKRIDGNRQEEFIKELRGYENAFDEIKIDDSNSPFSEPCNDLTDGLARMSRITPTIIKYANREGGKKLLVSLPQNLAVDTFLTEYGKLLLRIHREFYQKRMVAGRPKSKEEKANLILAFLKNKYYRHRLGGKTLSINKMARDASDLLQKRGVKGSSYENIRRNYIETLRQIRDAKNNS